MLVGALHAFQGAYGDRRQELVFIGLGVNDPVTRGSVYSALDDCLLTDAEMAVYEDARGVSKLSMMIMRAAAGGVGISCFRELEYCD